MNIWQYFLFMCLLAAGYYILIYRIIIRVREVRFIYCYHSLLLAVITLYLIKGPVPIDDIVKGEGGFANVLFLIWVYNSVFLCYTVFLVGYYLLFRRYLSKLSFIRQFFIFSALQLLIVWLVYLFLNRGAAY